MEISQRTSLCKISKNVMFFFYCFSFFFYKTEQKGGTGPVQGRQVDTTGRGELARKEDRRVNTM
jgi:hypothetical protein